MKDGRTILVDSKLADETKIIAIKKGITLQDAMNDALRIYIEQNQIN
jgi:uncharacterized protein (DUF4415 family)